MTDSKRIDRKDAEVLGTLTATVSMALDGLSDVNAPSPNDNDSLTWDAATSKWIPEAAGGGGTATAITLAYESTDTKCPVVAALDYTGDQAPKTVNNVYIDSTTGTLVAVGFSGPLTGNVTGNADTATSVSMGIDALTDVTITTPATSEVLTWNGTEWANQPSRGGAGAGVVQLFMDDTAIRPTSANNSYEVVTLVTAPVTTTAEVVDTVTVNANTVLAEAYLYDTALGGTAIEGGIWDFTVWRSADSTALTSELRFNIHRVISGGATTVTVTGTGTSRTCTASGGTPFDAGDASATIDACGFVMTPLGLYPITSRTSATEVTITTPSGYTNEAAVAFSVWRRLFQATTGDINDTTPNYTRQEILSAQPAYACSSTDKLGWIVFGKTTRTSNTIIAWTHNGTARYTHMHTPLVLRHNDLTGLDGGTTAQYYHLTSAQHASVGSAAAAYSALRFNGLADAQVLTTAADTTTTLDGTYASDLLITGTAVMQVYNLGTATAYANGKRFTFYNNTPEFVGVVTTDLSVFHRVPPRAKCHCILADNSTASGVWFSEVCESINPAYGSHVFADMIHQSSGIVYQGFGGLTVAVSGTGSSGSLLGIYAGGTQGFQQLNAGTTSTGYALSYSPGGCLLGSGCRSYTARQSVSILSTAAEEYICRYGIGNHVTGGAHTEGVYFLYDRNTFGANWQLKTIKTSGGAANTVNDSGVAVVAGTTHAEIQKLYLEVSSSGARADFWINNVLVSPSGGQGNTPTTTVYQAHQGMTRTAYSAVGKYLKIDYVAAQSYPTTLR